MPIAPAAIITVPTAVVMSVQLGPADTTTTMRRSLEPHPLMGLPGTSPVGDSAAESTSLVSVLDVRACTGTRCALQGQRYADAQAGLMLLLDLGRGPRPFLTPLTAGPLVGSRRKYRLVRSPEHSSQATTAVLHWKRSVSRSKHARRLAYTGHASSSSAGEGASSS
jgi:hypothetical protein